MARGFEVRVTADIDPAATGTRERWHALNAIELERRAIQLETPMRPGRGAASTRPVEPGKAAQRRRDTAEQPAPRRRRTTAKGMGGTLPPGGRPLPQRPVEQAGRTQNADFALRITGGL